MQRLSWLPLPIAIVLACSAARGDTILLRDEFDGGTLDHSLWHTPTGEGSFLGRTQIRPPEEPLEVAAGWLRLALDTHNPTALVPRDSFWGSEVVSNEVFERGAGLAFHARVRLDAGVPRGVLGSLFGFVFSPAAGHRDELTFELLGNDLHDGRERLLTNAFDDEDFTAPGAFQFVDVPGIDLTDWIELEIRWWPDRIEWLAGGRILRVERGTVPDAPMPVRLNFWAPDADFAAAYDADLQPGASAAENERFFYEVDWVEVARLDGAGCPERPLAGCRASAKGRLRLKTRHNGTGSLRWTAARLGDIPPADLAVGDARLCLYDGSDAAVLGIALPAGPAWRPGRRGLTFRNETTRLKLRARGRLSFKSRSLPALPLPLAERPIVAQLQASAGACWATPFAPPFRRNDERRFLAKQARVAPSEVRLALTDVPPLGSFADLRGEVTGLDGIEAMVTGYVDVGTDAPAWWGPKPTLARPGVPISAGRFTLDFTTGGIDHLARRVAVFVLPAAYLPPAARGASSLPAALSDAAFASEIVER